MATDEPLGGREMTGGMEGFQRAMDERNTPLPELEPKQVAALEWLLAEARKNGMQSDPADRTAFNAMTRVFSKPEHAPLLANLVTSHEVYLEKKHQVGAKPGRGGIAPGGSGPGDAEEK